MIRGKNIFLPIESKAVCEIYKLLHKNRLVSFVITQEAINKVDSLVASINSEYFGEQIYRERTEKAVAYLYFIIKNHPFTDGNKRTAVLTFEVVCELNNLKPNYKDSTLDEIAVYIESQKIIDHQDFIKRLSVALFE